MSWCVSREGDFAHLSREQWGDLYLFVEEGEQQAAFDVLDQIKPPHWPEADVMLGPPHPT
ncbi:MULTISPECIES: hypothetical protein [Prauserella]|uniref:Uncharacterized protein n=2 Tax=Prauserella TaxID=142577 RepID=A0A318LC33_9PSEU|nr:MULTISPECIES: hypothetical protein [Prauserella]PXY16672.1 hypothetical protein BAY59_38265 [Prauserella coralliicola]PXY16873.1 hypothetical protein BA062_38245 [Prauserella flavalba]TKG58264.1 hypothetical protein FCN18_38275 [Prauserella endophytica]